MMRSSSCVSNASTLSFSAYVVILIGIRGGSGVPLDGIPSSMTLTITNAHRMAQSNPTCNGRPQ